MAYVWTDDEENGLPGAPLPEEFAKLTPKKHLPLALSSLHPSLWTVALATAAIILVTLIDWASAGSSFASSRNAVFEQGQWQKLFLSMLSHADTPHLLSNLLGFVGFGFLLKRSFGLLAFPIVPLVTGVVITLLTNATTPAWQGLIGSSGIVFAMVGLYVTLYSYFEHRHSWSAKIMRVTGFVLILFFPHEYSRDISYLAHGYGFALGIVAGLILIPHLQPKGLDHRNSPNPSRGVDLALPALPGQSAADETLRHGP
jgi:membrane associated rhomboid family serine protease